MMRNMNKYYEDAGINTALLIQKDIIHEQANLYLQNSVADENHSGVRKPILNLAEVPPEHKLSNDLLYRNVPDEIRKNGRLLENEELFLLKLLDADGFISMPSRLTELILLMTRVHKVNNVSICSSTNCSFL